MTEQSTEETPEIQPGEQREVKYLGRTFTVTAPQPEQILVWQRTLNRLTQDNPQSWTSRQALDALDRLRKIVDSLLSPADIDWIDDRMLQLDPDTRRPRFTLENAHELLMMIIDEFKVKNREERRADERAAKKAPARRVAKKAAPAKATTRRTAR